MSAEDKKTTIYARSPAGVENEVKKSEEAEEGEEEVKEGYKIVAELVGHSNRYELLFLFEFESITTDLDVSVPPKPAFEIMTLA